MRFFPHYKRFFQKIQAWLARMVKPYLNPSSNSSSRRDRKVVRRALISIDRKQTGT
jgi:hypothetical protein